MFASSSSLRHRHQSATSMYHRVPSSSQHANLARMRERGVVCVRVCGQYSSGESQQATVLHRRGVRDSVRRTRLAASHAGGTSISGKHPLGLWPCTCEHAEETHRWLFDRGHFPLSVIPPLEGDVGHVEHGRKRFPHLYRYTRASFQQQVGQQQQQQQQDRSLNRLFHFAAPQAMQRMSQG